MTPLLTAKLAKQYVAVDALGLVKSTLQVWFGLVLVQLSFLVVHILGLLTPFLAPTGGSSPSAGWCIYESVLSKGGEVCFSSYGTDCGWNGRDSLRDCYWSERFCDTHVRETSGHGLCPSSPLWFPLWLSALEIAQNWCGFVENCLYRSWHAGKSQFSKQSSFKNSIPTEVVFCFCKNGEELGAWTSSGGRAFWKSADCSTVRCF